MKNTHLVSILLFLALSINSWAIEDPIASITFSNPKAENNISLVVNNNSSAEAYTTTTTIGGLDCMHIPGSKYAYFRVNDATIPSNDNKLIVRIKYYDTGYGSIALQYNSTDADYTRHSFDQTNSDTWATATIALSDASFRNAQNNSADFRLTGLSYIRSIEISRGELDPNTEEVPSTTGSAISEFKGKSVAGYQAWFTANATNAGWVHWSGNERPIVGDFSFEVYPDMRDYDEDEKYNSGFAPFGNGEPATLFSSAEVIDTHFDWMEEADIDGIALQRFITGVGKVITDVQHSKPILVKHAAEASDRIFYVCYDMSGNSADWAERIKFDWVFNIEQAYGLTSSPSYATVDDKPVVQVWGPGFTSRLGNVTETLDLIQFLKDRGCYVIGGVPTNWRTESGDSKPGFMPAYKSYDMVSPWTPGRYKDLNGVNNFKSSYIEPDKTFCEANGLDYMPVLFPGFAWSTWYENGGEPNKIPRIATPVITSPSNSPVPMLDTVRSQLMPGVPLPSEGCIVFPS